MDIFISHSSQDKEFVKEFLTLLRMSLRLSASSIICTTLDETQLDAGSDVNDTLRQKLTNSEVFIVILSPASIQSSYVLFELGARWGSGKKMIPLMMKGLNLGDISSPLLDRHVVKCDRAGIMNVIENTGQILDIEPEPEYTIEKELEKLINYEPRYLSDIAYAVLSYVVDKDLNFALLKDEHYKKIQPPGRRLNPLERPHVVAQESVINELNLPGEELRRHPHFNFDLYKKTSVVPPPYQVQEEGNPHRAAVMHYDFVYVFYIDRVKPNIRVKFSKNKKFDPKWYSLDEVIERERYEEYGPHEDMIPTMKRIKAELMEIKP